MGLKAPSVVATQLWVSRSQEAEGYHIRGTFMVNNLMAKMQLRELTLFDAVRLGLKIPNMHEDCVVSAKNLAPTLKLLGSVCRRIVGRSDYQHLTPIQKSTINGAAKMIRDSAVGRKEDLILEELCPHLLDHDLKPFRSPSVKGVRAVACSEISGFCIRMRVYQVGRPEVDIPIYYAKKLGVEIPDEVSTQYQNLIEAELMAKKLAAWFDAGGVKSESQTTISNLGSCVKDEFRRLLPWAMKSLVMQLMARWKAGDELAKRALSELQSFSWCFGTFSLRHSLLRILELGHDIPDGYSVLDREKHPRILICDDLVGVDEAGVLTWGESLGFAWGGWKVRSEELKRKAEDGLTVQEAALANVSERKIVDSEEIACKLQQAICRDYPSGVVWNNSTVALLSDSMGERIPDDVLTMVKKEMFERSDGTWLLSSMVVGKDRMDQMIVRAKELLENKGAFAMDSLYGEFEEDIQNILCGRDFKRFFNKFIADKADGKVRGHEGWRVCFKADAPEEEGWGIIADRVRAVLVSSGDAVSIEDILAQMPHLDREVILRVCQENIKDAVIFSMDEIQYAKLLEAYYLPDDFGETLSAFVNETESSQGVASIVLLEAEFEAKYGEGFRVNFGLEDDAVFKQVVAKSFAGDAHEWKKDTFISEHRRAESNVAEVFLQTHDGLFHEEDFFKFALESRGMKNRGMLILTFLRKHCVRLSKDWWISLSGFDRKVAITEEQYLQIGMVLNRCVGNNAFVPIAALSNEVYESLPRLELEGRVLEWNAYLLTSLSVLKVKNARVINDEPSPYTVTGLIVPYDVGAIRDVVEYAIHCYPTGYFSDADAAFDYLKANNIRMTKTEKLVAKINEMLKVV